MLLKIRIPENSIKIYARAKWTESDLQNAVKALKEKKGSIRKISQVYGVPARTLSRRMKEGNLTKGKLGRKCCLGEENEKKLVHYIQVLEKHGFAPTRQDILRLCYSFVEKNNIPHNFNRNLKQAGFDWFQGFKKRNKNLPIRRAQGVSAARKQEMIHKECDKFFKLLENICLEHNLTSSPEKIFNMGKIALQLNDSEETNMDGDKSVTNIITEEKGETVSIIACANADGSFLPPIYIFKQSDKKEKHEDSLSSDSFVIINENSENITTSIFKTWLKDHFPLHKGQGKVILILDGYTFHCSDVDVLDSVIENEIILLSLPSHTTQWLQPLDKSFFKPLKTFWNQAYRDWIHDHPAEKISYQQFPTLLNSSWNKATTTDNATSGFNDCGIFPLDPTKIPKNAFFPVDSDDSEANIEKPTDSSLSST